MGTLSDIDLAYLAGIIDGEGTISVGYGRSPHSRNPTLTCRLSVGNTSRELIGWLETFGGRAYLGRTKMANAKPYWTWVLLGRPAMDLVARIAPYLRIKRAQAALAANVEALLLPRNGSNALRVITPDLLARREALVAEFRRLNAKGAA
jgi:hypothetical protein